jgi:hypothetical protein
MRRTRYFLFTALLLSFSALAQNSLESDLFQKYFSPAERAGLQRIISFTDSLVLAGRTTVPVNAAYHRHLDSIAPLPDKAFPQEIVDPFLRSLDPALFDKIYVWSVPERLVTLDTVLIRPENHFVLEANRYGAYFSMIRELGDTSDYFRGIYENVQAADDISPNILAEFVHHNDRFDFDNIYHRLWAVVMLLWMGER